MAQGEQKKLSFLDKFLTLWIFLAMYIKGSSLLLTLETFLADGERCYRVKYGNGA